MVFGCFRVQPIQKFSAVNEKYGFFSRFRTKIPTSLSLRKSGPKITDGIYHRVGITTCSKTFAEFWSELKNLCECAKVVSDFYLYQLVSEREQKTCVASQCCLPAIINRAKKELGAPIFLSRKVSHSPPSPLVPPNSTDPDCLQDICSCRIFSGRSARGQAMQKGESRVEVDRPTLVFFFERWHEKPLQINIAPKKNVMVGK